MVIWNSELAQSFSTKKSLKRHLVRLSSIAMLATAVGCGSGSSNESSADFQSLQKIAPTREADALAVSEKANEAYAAEPAHATAKAPVKTVHRGNIELTSASTLQSAPVDEPSFEKGSPAWLIQEIAKRKTSLDKLATLPDQKEQYKREFERVHRDIIKLASEAVVKLNNEAGYQKEFNAAAHYLCQSRMQLALNGDSAQAQALAENAQALFERDATSYAAVESASRVLELIQVMATRTATPTPKWTLAYAKEAQKFVQNFPQETHRSALNLFLAGRMCEKLGFTSEAEVCYVWIEQTYPDSPFADQVVGSLRRLRLTGEMLTEFGGSTLTGSFVSAQQMRGKAMLVVFWASNSEQFQKDLKTIQPLLEQHRQQLSAVGVNMDISDYAATQFAQIHKMDWPQIFFSDASKRGDQNPLANHYGVDSAPQYWLVDKNGVVRSVNVSIDDLEEALQKAL